MRRGESLADARISGGIYARPRSGSRAAATSSSPSSSSVLVQNNKRNSGSEIIIDTTVSMEAEAEAWAALDLQPQPAPEVVVAAPPSWWWEVEGSTPLQLTYEEEWALFGMGQQSSTADTTAYEEDDSSSWRIDPIWNFNPTTTEAAAAAATINSKN